MVTWLRIASALGLVLAAGASLGACDLVLGLPDRHVDPHLVCAEDACACAPGFADCDRKPENGCEANLSAAPNCGTCGHDCQNGTCVMAACACAPGFADCDGKPENGCEVALDNHVASCDACDPGFADCDGSLENGCEAELDKDGANCGACGHDCLGGVCETGVCLPVVMGKFVMPQSFALAGSSLYVGVCETPSLYEIPITNGAAAPAATSTDCPFLMAVVGSTLYWASDTTIYLTQLGGAPTTPTTLVMNSNSELFFTASATQIYWYSFDLNTNAQALMRAPTGGGPAVTILADSSVNSIVTDAARAYWADQTGVHSVPHDSAVITNIEFNPALSALALAVDATNLYIGDTTQVKLRPLAGGKDKKLAAASYVDAIVVDADNVYWADSQNGNLSRVPIAGGATTALATGQTFDMGMPLYVDDQAVYWLADMQVRKVAK